MRFFKSLPRFLVVSLGTLLVLAVLVPVSAQVFTSISVADGGRRNPTIGFLADPTAGFFRNGAGVVGVATSISLPSLSAAVTPASVGIAVCAEQSLTVTGVLATDLVVLVNYPATGNAASWTSARVTGANTIGQTFCNPTAGALTPAAGTVTYLIIKQQ